MDEPRISVALVTRNRPESLERTLVSLRAQDRQPFEIIVSDDSDDERAPETMAVAEAHGCVYRGGPRRGLYANRNAAALECTGTHVRTMDDDHEFPPAHWARCEEAVSSDPDAVWIIGEVVPSLGQWKTDECPGELHPRGFSVSPRDPDRTWAIADGASIYPVTVFRSGLRFSEVFKFGASYLEFGSRLHYLGWRIRCLRSTHIVHHLELRNRSFDDAEEDLAAKCFAALSHSLAYQPTARNRILTVAEIARDVATKRRLGVRALRRGYAAYRVEQRELNRRR